MAEKTKTVPPCPAHPEQAAGLTCVQCGKPICRLCIEQFGYFCSTACKEVARQSIPAEDPTVKAAAAARYQKTMKGLKIAGAVLAGLVLLGFVSMLWKFWLNPAGKIAWQWKTQTALDGTRVLAGDDQTIVVLAGERVVTLNPKTGDEITAFNLPAAAAAESANADDDDESGGDFDFMTDEFYPGGLRLEPLVDGFLLIRGDTIRRLAADGTVKHEKSYPDGKIQVVAKTAAGDRCYYVAVAPADPVKMRQARDELQKLEAAWTAGADTTARSQALYEQLQDNRTWLVALDLSANQKLWSKELNRGITIPRLAAGAGTVTAEFHIAPASGEAMSVLCAIQPDTGEKAWQVKLPESLAWGPAAVGGVILFSVASELHAVAEDGTEKYSLSLPEEDYAQLFLKDGLLFVVTGGGTKCCDPATGKTLWTLAMAVNESSLMAAGERLFIRAEVEEALADGGSLKAPPGFEQVKDMKDFEGIMKKATSRSVSMLLALDRATGKELWRRRSVYGRLIVNENRLLAIADTSETSMLERIGGGKGRTVLRQFSVSSGSDIFTREYDIGLAHPILAGKRLAAVCYERRYQAGLAGAFSSSAVKEQPVPAQGVIAFKIN